jgi:tetratricopeptide (TPR) repeat protein
MYNIIPLILILASLTVIIIITVRKFPVLANLDVENIPREKEAKFKEQIISGRLKRNIIKWWSELMKIVKPSADAIGRFFKLIHIKLYEIKESYKSAEVLPAAQTARKISELLGEAEELTKGENFDEAEKKLIEVINLDSKNIEAFRALGELYYERRNFKEAKETFNHVLKLEEEESAETYFDLSLACKEMGDIGEALNNIKKALGLEPNNPRYLDMLFDISIINKDKAGALAAYKKLKEANPENQKLGEMEKLVKSL